MEIFFDIKRLVVQKTPYHTHEINKKRQIGLHDVYFYAFTDEHRQSRK